MTHYQMTLPQHRATIDGRYVDPDRYKQGHRDYQPEMLCRTGDAHASGTRIKRAVTCPRCLVRLGTSLTPDLLEV